MKSILLVLGLSAMSFMVYQGPTVPKVVQDAFLAKFPQAKHVQWEEEEDGEYEAEFKMGKQEMSANFKGDGSWLETETEIKKSKLPKAVKKAIAVQFRGFEIEEAEKVETPDLPLAYEIELKNKAKQTEIEAVFDVKGALLMQEKEKENDEDNEKESN